MTDIINIAIVEDEKIQSELMKKYVAGWASKKNIWAVAEAFYSAESFDFNWSMNKKYDIVLLDIQMSGQNGIELAKKIREEDNMIGIIFITAVTDYIQEGYDVSAINYLIKPVDEKKLHECLDRALQKIPEEEKSILIDAEGEIIRVRQKDIIYIEAFSHTIDINTTEKKLTVRKSISSIEKELDEKMFVRCHRSYIVGLKYVKRIESSKIELDNGKLIPVSRRQYSNTNIAFINYYRGGINE